MSMSTETVHAKIPILGVTAEATISAVPLTKDAASTRTSVAWKMPRVPTRQPPGSERRVWAGGTSERHRLS